MLVRLENGAIFLPGRAKVGISAAPEMRAADIEASILEKYGDSVQLVRVLCVRLFLYRGVEKAVHRFISMLPCRAYRNASGGTEFFITLNPLLGLLVMLLLYCLNVKYPPLLAILVGVIPLPLDMCLLVLLLAAVEYAALIAAAYLGWIALSFAAGL